VIRHMEAGMERWGVPVPHGVDEEKTELALSFDDAEFQHDPTSDGATGPTGPTGANGASGANGADGTGKPSGASGTAEHLSA